jgi:hypothetical protein
MTYGDAEQKEGLRLVNAIAEVAQHKELQRVWEGWAQKHQPALEKSFVSVDAASLGGPYNRCRIL